VQRARQSGYSDSRALPTGVSRRVVTCAAVLATSGEGGEEGGGPRRAGRKDREDWEDRLEGVSHLAGGVFIRGAGWCLLTEIVQKAQTVTTTRKTPRLLHVAAMRQRVAGRQLGRDDAHKSAHVRRAQESGRAPCRNERSCLKRLELGFADAVSEVPPLPSRCGALSAEQQPEV
jgi:hypothetical protein